MENAQRIMSWTKPIILFLLSLLCFGCGTMHVDHDFDQAIAFSSLTTYDYDFGSFEGLSEFDERRFITYADSILSEKGMRRSENNALWLSVQASEFEKSSNNTLGVGIGGGSGNVGIGVSGGIPIGAPQTQQVVRTQFSLDSSNTVIWEATSESILPIRATPSERDDYYKKLLTAIFKKYPPRQ